MLFLCENNLYAMGTALKRSESEIDLSLKATSYEIPAWPVDGMDVVACEDAARRAVAAVRAGAGPYFIEFRTYRFRATRCTILSCTAPSRKSNKWKTRDPIVTFQARLRELGLRVTATSRRSKTMWRRRSPVRSSSPKRELWSRSKI